MKRLLTCLVALSLIFTLSTPVFATITYDDDKPVIRNQIDALIAIANSIGASITTNDVLWVDGDRTDTYTATGGIGAPFKTIAAAKAASVSGDVILVAPGAYAEVVTLTAGTSLFGWNVTGATLTGNYWLFAGDTATLNSHVTVPAGNLTLTLGNATLTDGDLTLTDGDLTMTSGSLTLTLGNATLTDGDLTLTDGDLTLTSGDMTLAGGTIAYPECTIADGDATPDVAGCTVLVTSANTGATEITDLDNPVVGSIVYLIGGSATNSSTISDAANFNLSAGWTAAVDDVLILYIQADNDYIELGRVNN